MKKSKTSTRGRRKAAPAALTETVVYDLRSGGILRFAHLDGYARFQFDSDDISAEIVEMPQGGHQLQLAIGSGRAFRITTISGQNLLISVHREDGSGDRERQG